MTICFTHVAIRANDLDLSVEFYRQFCGMTPVNDRRAKGGETIWLAMTGDIWPALFLLVLDRSSSLTTINHLGFQVDTIDRLIEIERRALQAAILMEPITNSGRDVAQWMMVKDPSSNIVEFTFGQPIRGIPSFNKI
jgi:catechol 2,3-dioxygenase-like lactoylglutathione lyase family enzyme